MKVMWFSGYFWYRAGRVRSGGLLCQGSKDACAPESLHRARSRHIVLTALAASQSVTCLREHSTGLTQNMLTSASFSQKPIKLIVGHIIRLTDRVRWRIVNECRTGGKTRQLIGTEHKPATILGWSIIISFEKIVYTRNKIPSAILNSRWMAWQEFWYFGGSKKKGTIPSKIS